MKKLLGLITGKNNRVVGILHIFPPNVLSSAEYWNLEIMLIKRACGFDIFSYF